MQPGTAIGRQGDELHQKAQEEAVDDGSRQLGRIPEEAETRKQEGGGKSLLAGDPAPPGVFDGANVDSERGPRADMAERGEEGAMPMGMDPHHGLESVVREFRRGDEDLRSQSSSSSDGEDESKQHMVGDDLFLQQLPAQVERYEIPFALGCVLRH